MRLITECSDLRGKYVVVRASFNIPLEADGTLRNLFRFNRALPTLRYLHEAGARVIIVSHIGRKPEETLKPVFAVLEKHLPATWGGDVRSEEFLSRRNLLNDGDLLMAENLRQHEAEIENNPEFATQLASLGDIYVNDAFAEAHREHASTFGIATHLPAYAGLTLAEEVDKLQTAMKPEHPSLFLLGGAKFETKMPLIEKFLDLYDYVFVGGALANDIFKARGLEVGQSMVSPVSLAGSLLLSNPKLLVPIDVMVEGPDGKVTKRPEDITPEEKILDCGPMTVDMLATYIEDAETILWNGPFGAYEMGYEESTERTAKLVAESSAYSVIGGGDTVAAIEKMKLNDAFGFVSVGGGSMLEFLEQGTTSVIDILK